MQQANTTKRDNDGPCGAPGDAGGPRAGAASCCGAGAPESAGGCPCKGMFKSHRLTAVVVLAAVALAVLISQAGGVLGIVAFVRTF